MSAPSSWRATQFIGGQPSSYARSIGAASVAARQPVGFAAGGPTVRVTNTSTTVYIAFAAYNFALLQGDPTLVFPADGAPPVGQPVTVIGPGQTVFFDIAANSDSFAAIGNAAGPTVIIVQRGEGTGP
jgi:hypothetical protein